jgi:c-di-GMP-binding flagellar brake protein YcgR
MASERTERRKNSRNALKHDSELTLAGNAVYKGTTKNISFSGVYMYCQDSKNIPIGENGFFKIFIKSQKETVTISFLCQVIRTDDEGVGLKFIDIDLAGYQKFKNLMLYNSSDPDTLLAELEKSPGLEIKKG